MEEGIYRSAAQIAEAEGVARRFVNRLPRLTLLAPDIIEAILDGGQQKGLQIEELTRRMPSEWEEQRKALRWRIHTQCSNEPDRFEYRFE